MQASNHIHRVKYFNVNKLIKQPSSTDLKNKISLSSELQLNDALNDCININARINNKKKINCVEQLYQTILELSHDLSMNNIRLPQKNEIQLILDVLAKQRLGFLAMKCGETSFMKKNNYIGYYYQDVNGQYCFIKAEYIDMYNDQVFDRLSQAIITSIKQFQQVAKNGNYVYQFKEKDVFFVQEYINHKCMSAIKFNKILYHSIIIKKTSDNAFVLIIKDIIKNQQAAKGSYNAVKTTNFQIPFIFKDEKIVVAFEQIKRLISISSASSLSKHHPEQFIKLDTISDKLLKKKQAEYAMRQLEYWQFYDGITSNYRRIFFGDYLGQELSNIPLEQLNLYKKSIVTQIIENFTEDSNKANDSKLPNILWKVTKGKIKISIIDYFDQLFTYTNYYDKARKVFGIYKPGYMHESSVLADAEYNSLLYQQQLFGIVLNIYILANNIIGTKNMQKKIDVINDYFTFKAELLKFNNSKAIPKQLLALFNECPILVDNLKQAYHGTLTFKMFLQSLQAQNLMTYSARVVYNNGDAFIKDKLILEWQNIIIEAKDKQIATN